MSAPRARIIVTAYNQLPYLRRTLRGWLRQTVRNFTVVVADDGSTDGTAEFLAEFSPELEARGIGFEHVWQPDEGFRKNRILNEAVRRTRDEQLLVFTDGDCIAPARFVERQLAAHEPRSFHVGGAYRLSREVSEGLTEADVDSGRFESLGTPEQLRDLRKRARKSHIGTWLRRRNRPKILGLNMAFDRALFEALNGLDERFESWGVGEDSDLRDRAMRSSPRPRVKVFYTTNDVFHLWHRLGTGRREKSGYFREQRPVRCEMGLIREGAARAPSAPERG